MSSVKKPTQKQKDFLRTYELPVLRSRSDCGRVIGSIFGKVPREGWTFERKTYILRMAIQKFADQLVRRMGTDDIGRVKYLVILDWTWSDNYKEMCGAYVDWENDKKDYHPNPLSCLKIITCPLNLEMSGGKSVAIPQ